MKYIYTLYIYIYIGNNLYDSLSVLYRGQLPDNKTEYDLFLNRKQTVYYIKNEQCMDSQPRITFEPFTRNSTTNSNQEDEYLSILNEYINNLIFYLIRNYRYSFENIYEFRQFYSEPRYHYGFQCIDNNRNCLGDNRDAQYWAMQSLFKLDDNSIYFIIGVNHHNLNMSLYSNIVLYGIGLSAPIPGPGITNFEYDGSAQILNLQNFKVNFNKKRKYYNYYYKKRLENLFVVQLTRPQNCILDLPGFCLSENEWSKNNITTIAVRDYLNPMSKTRPNHNEIISPIVLKFKISY